MWPAAVKNDRGVAGTAWFLNLTSPYTNGVPRKGTLMLMPVGFYRRGYQVKTLFLFREGGRHPAPSADARTLAGTRLAAGRTDFPVVTGDVFQVDTIRRPGQKVSGRGRCRSWHSNHDRRRYADALRVKAVKTRAQIDVRLEAERVRGQTDSQVGMPEDSSCQLHM